MNFRRRNPSRLITPEKKADVASDRARFSPTALNLSRNLSTRVKARESARARSPADAYVARVWSR